MGAPTSRETFFLANFRGKKKKKGNILPLIVVTFKVCFTTQWRITRISPILGRQLSVGAPGYDFTEISRKLHEIKANSVTRGGGRASPAPPLFSPLLLALLGFILSSVQEWNTDQICMVTSYYFHLLAWHFRFPLSYLEKLWSDGLTPPPDCWTQGM